MIGQLTDISLRELLEKFGAGNHKPGSGSASALYGMVAAKLLRTVIDLTDEPKRRKKYADYLPELIRIKKEIDNRIFRNLDYLFQRDSEQFDGVIRLREERDKETDFEKKRALSQQEKEALKRATKIPLQIAELCMELGDFATYVFDHGFRSARGDSGAALNGAISGISSCLFIIELNLISLPSDPYTEKIREDNTKIKAGLQRLATSQIAKLKVLEDESQASRLYQQSIDEFKKGNLADGVRKNSDIEQIAKRLQNTLWVNRDRIWKNEVVSNPLQVLKPDAVLKKVLEYSYRELETLGAYEQAGELYEIAGIIDKDKRLIQVSKDFPLETRCFTAAHELGHLILHKDVVLHRDRPIDGSAATPRNPTEMQADKFAAYFLMPANLVKNVFLEIYDMEKFAINETTVLAIGGGTVSGLRRQCQNAHGLALLLAETEIYGGKQFNSMAKIFGVSVTTMAIRLEELGLFIF